MTSRAEARLLGGVELGGTKVVCAVGLDGVPEREERIPTGEPEETLARVEAFLREVGPPSAVGVGSFGPVELRPGHPRFGRITTTPKPGWAGVDVAGRLGRALGVPVAFETDVGAAAVGEGRLGAARGLHTFAYLTVGTGIGGGVVAGGRLLHGLGHPEIGHVPVPREPGDEAFASVCPFHPDCLEGLASGPSLAARFGRPAEELGGPELDRAVELAAGYVASGLRALVYVLAPERIVIGGGVSGLPGLVDRVAALLPARLGRYPGLPEHSSGFVVPAMLGARAGIAGALLLAQDLAAATG